MIIIDYDRKKHGQIIHACVLALKDGKTVVYPTDTSYGLACDMTQPRAVKKLYAIKGRDFDKLIHMVVPSVEFARQVGEWNSLIAKLVKAFWPGALSIVVPLRAKKGTIGLRLPDNLIARDLAKVLDRPISATSANQSGQPDSYSLKDILNNFQKAKHKPDIIINAGRLPKRKPSTLIKVEGLEITILRRGPVSEKQIKSILK